MLSQLVGELDYAAPDINITLPNTPPHLNDAAVDTAPRFPPGLHVNTDDAVCQNEGGTLIPSGLVVPDPKEGRPSVTFFPVAYPGSPAPSAHSTLDNDGFVKTSLPEYGQPADTNVEELRANVHDEMLRKALIAKSLKEELEEQAKVTLKPMRDDVLVMLNMHDKFCGCRGNCEVSTTVRSWCL